MKSTSDHDKKRSFELKNLAVLLPLAVAAVMCGIVIKRELWFDEALTLMNFVLPLDLSAIYFNYTIPNNQIVYSMLLKIWDNLNWGFMDLTIFWRLLSVIFSMAFILIIMQLRSKTDESRYPALLVLSVMSVSSVFINYATALRGYAASWCFIAMMLYALYLIFKAEKRSGWLLYVVSALLAAGTVPTNLLAMSAALAYALVWMQKEFWQDKRFYLAAAVIPLALIVFYAPIAKNFLATFKLGEGFATRTGALGMVLGMYVSCFGLLLLFAPWGMSKKPLPHYLSYLIWLMPAAAIFILHKAPFPRVFVTMLPVLAMLIIDGIKKVVSENWRIYHQTAFFLLAICVQALLLPGLMLAASKCSVSDVEDDFFRPYYMAKSYRPAAAAEDIKQQSGGKVVFLSFNSDPLPILFYSLLNNTDTRNYVCDIPYNSVKILPYGTTVVLKENEDIAAMEKRFNCKLILLKELGRLKLCRAE